MKKSISLLLAVMMLVLTLVSPFGAYAAEDYMNEPIMIENRLDSQGFIKRADRLGSAVSTYSIADDSSVKKTYNKTTYYGNGKELYTQIRNKLDARSEEFTIKYYSTTRLHPELLFEINTMRNKIMEQLEQFFLYATDDSISVSSTDGDYAHWSVSQYGANGFAYDYSDSKGYYYTIDLVYIYYTDAAQEKKVDSVINSFVNSIRKQNLSDYEILKKVHDYICESTTYDYDALEDPYGNLHAFSAYGALVYGKCVCQGYALAFYRICKDLGYSVRLLYSDLHAWNLVMADGKYYFVDCTWDDEFSEIEEYQDQKYYYFLVNYDTSVSQDSGSDAHTISEELCEDEYYIQNYSNKYADLSYDYDAEPLLSTAAVALSQCSYTYDGNAKKPAVTVTDKNGVNLTEGTDYTVSYSSNIQPGRAIAKITGKGKYAGMSAQRTYIINPAKMGSLSLKSGSRTATSVTLTWSKPAGTVSGYQLQVYKNGAWTNLKTVTTASTTSYNVTGLNPSSEYQFRIRSYKTISKINNYGAYSNTFKTITIPKKAAISSLTSGASKKITVKWSKLACNGYQIQYSTSSKFTNAKTVTISKNTTTSKTISGLKGKQKYYVRIRAYKTYNSTKYYTAWSGAKSITAAYFPSTVKLAKTSYAYDGKTKKPAVTIKNSKGKKVSTKNYTVSYSSGRKNVGTYTVTIKFKGSYSGTVKKTFTIKPKSTTLSSVKAKSKGFTVKWKKQTAQTTGYQIQYSTSSSFKNPKTVTVSKNSTTSKTISGLNSKKKYYVRVRTYKTVKGTKYYSSWSSKKSVVTK